MIQDTVFSKSKAIFLGVGRGKRSGKREEGEGPLPTHRYKWFGCRHPAGEVKLGSISMLIRAEKQPHKLPEALCIV